MALHNAELGLCLGTPPLTHECLEVMLFEEILKQGEGSLASLEEAFLYILQSRAEIGKRVTIRLLSGHTETC